MNYKLVTQIERDVAGEVEQVRRAALLRRDRTGGIAGHQFGVPVEEHPTEEPGHEGQTGTVDAHGGLSAPAVLHAQIAFGPGHHLRPELILRQKRGRNGIFR